MKNFLFFCIIVIILIKNLICDNWEYKLYHDLFLDYNPSIRPSIKHNLTLNVTFGLALVQIIDVVSGYC